MSSSGQPRSVNLEAHDGVGVITLDRPPVNAVSVEVALQLGEALDAALEHEDVLVIVVTGAGQRAFSAGSDIHEIAELLGPGEAVRHKLRPQNEVFDRLARSPKPTIAALNGDTLGGGLEIAVCCDLIVAGADIRIGSPEITLGLFPSSGGTFRVARRIGPGRAKEMQLLGTPITTEVALAWGLINRIAAPDRVLDEALVLAQTLLQRSPTALAMCKSVIERVEEPDHARLLEHSFAASEQVFTSTSAAQAVRGFIAGQRFSS